MNKRIKSISDLEVGLINACSSVRSIVNSLASSSEKSVLLAELDNIIETVNENIAVAGLPIDEVGLEMVSRMLGALSRNGNDDFNRSCEEFSIGSIHWGRTCVPAPALCSDPIRLGSFLSRLDLLVVAGTNGIPKDFALAQSLSDLNRLHSATLRIETRASLGASDALPSGLSNASTSASTAKLTRINTEILVQSLLDSGTELNQSIRLNSLAVRLKRLLSTLVATCEQKSAYLAASSVRHSSRLAFLTGDKQMRSWLDSSSELRKWAASELAVISKGILINVRAILQPGSYFEDALTAQVDAIDNSYFRQRKIGRHKEISLDPSVVERDTKELSKKFRATIADELSLLQDETSVFMYEFNARVTKIGGLEQMEPIPLPSLDAVLTDQSNGRVPDAPKSERVPRLGILNVLFAGRRLIFPLMFMFPLLGAVIGLGPGGFERSDPLFGKVMLGILLGAIPVMLIISARENREAMQKAHASLRANWSLALKRFHEGRLRGVLTALDREMHILDSVGQESLIRSIDLPIRDRDDAFKEKCNDCKNMVRETESKRARLAEAVKDARGLLSKIEGLHTATLAAVERNLEGWMK